MLLEFVLRVSCWAGAPQSCKRNMENIASNLQHRWTSWMVHLRRSSSTTSEGTQDTEEPQPHPRSRDPRQRKQQRHSETAGQQLSPSQSQSHNFNRGFDGSCSTLESVVVDNYNNYCASVNGNACDRDPGHYSPEVASSSFSSSSSSISTSTSFSNRAQSKLKSTTQWISRKVTGNRSEPSDDRCNNQTPEVELREHRVSRVTSARGPGGISESASAELETEGHSVFARVGNLFRRTSPTSSERGGISTQSLQIQLINIANRMWATLLNCFGRKNMRDLIETISTPQPLQSPLELPIPEDTNEICVKFASIVDELDLTHENKVIMLELPLEKKWQIYCSKVNEQEVLFNYTPEYYIDRLTQNINIPIAKQSTKLYDSLKTSLRTQPNSFVQRFLELNGLDHLLQNSAIGCLKALLNNSSGRAFVLAHPNALNIISQSLAVDDGKAKIDVLEILGAVCLVPGGHRKVLTAVNYFQEWYGERARFQTLVTELDYHPFKEQFTSDNTNYKLQVNIKTAIISFLNAILSYGPGQSCLEFRLHLRYELLMLGIMPVIDKLRNAFSESATLVKHLNFFEEMRIEDEKEYAAKFDLVHIDFSNLNEVLGLLCEKLSHSTEYSCLSSTLVHLLIMGVSDQRWSIIDRLVQQITLDAYNVQDAIIVEDLIQKLATDTVLNLENNVESLKRENAELLEKLGIKDGEIEQLMTELIVGREKYQEVVTQLQTALMNSHNNANSVSDASIVTSPISNPDPDKVFGSSQDAQFKNRFESLKSSLANSTSSPILSPTGKFPPPIPNGCVGGPPPPPPPMFGMLPQSQKPKGKQPPSSSTPLKSFNWSKLPESKIQPGTIWWNIQEQYDDLDLQEIDRLFSAKTSTLLNGISDSREQSQVQQRKMLTLIDSRRAQNCTILLSKLKMSDEELCKVIESMDTKDQLPIDMIEQLLKFVPTSEEKALLEEHQEDELYFARADTFLLNVSRIPRYEERLRSLQFRKRFPGLSKDLQWKMSNVIKACTELQTSKQFMRILQLVLSLGNYMNRGGRGNASGFKLSSLTRLADTKSTCKTTLVNYLVNQIEEKYPAVMSVENEIKSVKEAAKVSLPELEKDMVYLRTGLQQKEESLEAKYKIESLEKLFNDMKRKFSETVALFGEDYTQIDEFFMIFDQFLNILCEAKMENLRRLKKKRDEELQQQQQSTLRRQAKTKEPVASNSNGNNDFDDLISALRTGDVFSDLDHTKKKRCRKSRERIH